uniref:Uncharacterized protein n=1 Tax=Panagrolaimus sp. PS1159 TaxID=55785 RepID=A0AC35FZS1_9BILA
MILPKEFYDRCSPSYKKVIKELEKKLSDINKSNDEKTMNAKKILSAILDFSKRYLTPKEYWEYCFRKFRSGNSWKISESAFYHFFITDDFMDYLYAYLCWVWN